MGLDTPADQWVMIWSGSPMEQVETSDAIRTAADFSHNPPRLDAHEADLAYAVTGRLSGLENEGGEAAVDSGC